MKATLEFDLPLDRDDYEMCRMGRDMWLQLWDIDNELRNKLKHCELGEDARALATMVRDMIAQIDMDIVS